MRLSISNIRHVSTVAAAALRPSVQTPFPSPASRFTSMPPAEEDAILGVTAAYHADPAPIKVNLGVGAYRCDKGLPKVLSAVRHAEARINNRHLDMEYLPIDGSPRFCEMAARLIYGSHIDLKRVATIQTLSGTGALCIAGVLMRRHLEPVDVQGAEKLVLLPEPTWANHPTIFGDAGMHVGWYKYWGGKEKGLDWDACIESLLSAPNGCAILLHACAHNPTGMDPSDEQWKELSCVLKSKKMQPVFDMAYQGFTSGDLDADAKSVRTFVEDGHKVIVAQSFSKNFGLYGQRVGCLSVVTEAEVEREIMQSQLKAIARGLYSNPPFSGARIVEEILGDPELKQLWKTEMTEMAHRIRDMRFALRNNLAYQDSSQNWDHIVKQKGMFCYSGLTKEEVWELRDRHAVYMTDNGRMSMAGVTSQNVEYLASALHAVSK